MKKEKEENIWKRKKMKLFGDGTYLVGIGGEEQRMREEKIFGKYSWGVEGLKVILKAASGRKGYAKFPTPQPPATQYQFCSFL